MKTLISVATLFVASSAVAGVHIENTTRNIATKVVEGAPMVTQLQDGKIRSSRGMDGGMIIVGTTITILDDKRKQYREMDKESIKKMGAKASDAMAKMQERMKNMTPEQRAQMEQMMGKHVPGGLNAGKDDVWASKDTGKSETVEGRKCQVWTLSRNGALIEELCVVPFKSLPGTEDFEKAFKEMADAFAELAKAMPNADSAVKARTNIQGYPVRTRSYTADGKYRGEETVLTKWSVESIPASAFQVPAGYKKAEMPKF